MKDSIEIAKELILKELRAKEEAAADDLEGARATNGGKDITPLVRAMEVLNRLQRSEAEFREKLKAELREEMEKEFDGFALLPLELELEKLDIDEIRRQIAQLERVGRAKGMASCGGKSEKRRL